MLEVRNDETIAPHRFEFSGAINITIVLRGIDENRTIRLGSNGTMFTVRPDVTLILGNNITLQGHSQNNAPLVLIYGGILRMNVGVVIIGFTNDLTYGNVVRNGNGVLARRGHAIFVNHNRCRETTAGPSVQMNLGRAGGWDS